MGIAGPVLLGQGQKNLFAEERQGIVYKFQEDLAILAEKWKGHRDRALLWLARSHLGSKAELLSHLGGN